MMRTIAFWLLLGAIGAAVPPAVIAYSKANEKAFWERTYVKVHGHMAPANGSPLEATLTFAAPVRLPKTTLDEGTYLFRIVTPSTLRISSVDGTKLFATFPTRTVTRTKDLSQPLVKFERTSSVLPPVLVALFAENASVGYQLTASKTPQQDR